MPQINPTPFMNVKSNQSKRPDIQNLCVFMSLAAAESYLAAVLLNNWLWAKMEYPFTAYVYAQLNVGIKSVHNTKI